MHPIWLPSLILIGSLIQDGRLPSSPLAHISKMAVLILIGSTIQDGRLPSSQLAHTSKMAAFLHPYWLSDPRWPPSFVPIGSPIQYGGSCPSCHLIGPCSTTPSSHWSTGSSAFLLASPILPWTNASIPLVNQHPPIQSINQSRCLL